MMEVRHATRMGERRGRLPIDRDWTQWSVHSLRRCCQENCDHLDRSRTTPTPRCRHRTHFQFTIVKTSYGQ